MPNETRPAEDMELIQDIRELIERSKAARASAREAVSVSQELKTRYEELTSKHNPLPNQ